MEKFKVGDLVECVNKNGNQTSSLVIGKIYTVTDTREESGEDVIRVDAPEARGVNWSCYQFKIKKTNMSIKEKFTLAFKKEPEKSFRKAGITNGDDFLTEEGQSIFLTWLLKKHGEEFKKEVVDGILEDLKDEE